LGGSFHGPGGDAASWNEFVLVRFIEVEEQLRREGENAAVRLAMEECAAGHWLATAQPLVERGAAAWRMKLHRNCEVELVDIAGANPLVNCRDALGILLFG